MKPQKLALLLACVGLCTLSVGCQPAWSMATV